MLKAIYPALLSDSSEQRNVARFRIIDGLARRLGFRVYNHNLLWTEEIEELSAQWWSRPNPGPGSGLKDRHFNLYSLAKSLTSLSGDTAECGAYYGSSSFLICLANQGKQNHEHHIFDSFEGLSKPDVHDRMKNVKTPIWKEHDLAVSLETVQANLSVFDFVRYYQGWIPACFHEVADRHFSFVHIDVDLYQPTHDSLTFFYERMVPGGIILCDDYGFSTCPGATKAFDELLLDKPEKKVVHLSSGQGLIIKR